MNNKKLINYSWVLKIVTTAFFLSIFFSLGSELIIPNVNIFIGIIIVLMFITVGIVFDVIGVAVATCDARVLHSLAAKKMKGANIATKLKKNADKVSTICNDVVGDVCGIVSGSAGIFIATSLSQKLNFEYVVVSLLITAIISALTIGGKSLCKTFAIRNSEKIVYNFSKIIFVVYKPKK